MPKFKRYIQSLDDAQRKLYEYIDISRKKRLEQLQREIRELIEM